MKNLVLITTLASILSACSTLASVSDRLPGSADRSSPRSAAPDTGVPDAVTRNTYPTQERRLPNTQPVESAPSQPVQSEPVRPATPQQGIDPSINPATARSYSATWEEGGYRYRSVMFPHVIDGCKVMIQSRRTLDYVGGSEGEFFEREGLDCDCDLRIDNFQTVFAALNDEYKTPRMLEVCLLPGVDGATRQLEIMREGLKEERNFEKMKNVEGF